MFVHAMFAELIGHGQKAADWKCVGSKVNEDTGSQRTETYTTTPAGTGELRPGTVYLDTSLISISRWRMDSVLPPPRRSVHGPDACAKAKGGFPRSVI